MEENYDDEDSDEIDNRDNDDVATIVEEAESSTHSPRLLWIFDTDSSYQIIDNIIENKQDSNSNSNCNCNYNSISNNQYIQ